MGSAEKWGLILARGILAKCASVLAALPWFVGGPALAEYPAVSEARLRAPEPHNWLQVRGTDDAWGYSALDQVDVSNVGDLVPVWTFSTGVREAHEAAPLVNEGRMFITTPGNRVLAIDARTGELLWRYERELPDDLFQLHPTNRGVALYGRRVYLATVDAAVVALDAASGEVVWEREVEDYAAGYYMTLAPLAADGKILVGVSGGEFGVRGFVQAFDAASGDSVWKTYTIPGPGEPGNETWPGDTWQTGGVPVWVTGSYDAELGLTYWGTGNAGPWTGDTRGAADNLYATSVIALDVKTGALRAHHQYHWNDSWDWDEVSTPVLIDFQRGDRRVRGLVHAGRNGYLWFLERDAGSISFVEAKPYVRQDVFTALDPKTGRPSYDPARVPGLDKAVKFCPSFWGGKNWPPASFHPGTRLLYIPANENLCGKIVGVSETYRPGELFFGVKLDELDLVLHPDAHEHIGELQAWNVDTGEEVWSVEFASQNWGPILSTAGNLLFAGGTNDRAFRAFDARSGKELWKQRTNSGVVGMPSSYAIDGVQYIAVLSGWGVDAARKQDLLNKHLKKKTYVPQGGVLWVFALPERHREGRAGEPGSIAPP